VAKYVRGSRPRISTCRGTIIIFVFLPTMHAQLIVRFLTARIPLDIRSKDSSIRLSYIWLQVRKAQREGYPLPAGSWQRIGRGRKYVRTCLSHHPIFFSFFWVSCYLVAPFIGDAHRRQRKVMLPAFGTSESRALIPIFESAVAKVASPYRRIRIILITFGIFVPFTIIVEPTMEGSSSHIR
jgi:hypothetical protein